MANLSNYATGGSNSTNQIEYLLARSEPDALSVGVKEEIEEETAKNHEIIRRDY